MKVLVVGATGGSGRAAVTALLDRGHDVTVFVRNPETSGAIGERAAVVTGDATRPDDVDVAVRGQDAVIVTLGISENPVRVRMRGPAGTALDVRSRGTRNIVAAMERHDVGRLVVQTSYGVGDTRGKLPRRYALMFRALLGPQIADTEIQDALVRASDVLWTLVQPVNLTDGASGTAETSDAGEVAGWHVARGAVGEVLADAVERSDYVKKTIAVS
ncbi:NAD(P)-dependent oxidoreductase [Rhodococcus coprophilus]|uniref:NAD(P)-dependent oxidoreductase n=1 Tax=Rhodococcus coprophilus TaxID=38310 RepID=UPI0033E84583